MADVPETTPERAQTVNQQLTQDVWAVWQEHQKHEKVLNPTEFYRVSMITFAHMASILAVDTHMPLDQFIAVCIQRYQETLAKAPKFS